MAGTIIVYFQILHAVLRLVSVNLVDLSAELNYYLCPKNLKVCVEEYN